MKKFIVLAIAALITLPSATMAQETTIQRETREQTYKPQTHSVPVWYQGEVSVGFVTGGRFNPMEKTDFSRPLIETVHGVRITNYAFVGLGVGVQYAYGKISPDDENSHNWCTMLMPVFVNLKGYYPVSDKFSPYLTLSLGGSAVLMTDEYEFDYDYKAVLAGGFLYCKLGVGLNYRKFMVDFGLMHQGLADKHIYSTTVDRYFEKFNIGINSFYVNLGFKF